MLRKTTTIAFVMALVACAAYAKPVTVKSPDSRTVLSFEGFKYSVTVDGKQIIAPSAISMTLSDGTLYGGSAKLSRVKRSSVDNTVASPFYKRSQVRDRYNQAVLSYKNFDLVLRAYDEGVAYRFVSKSKKRFSVREEQATFAFPADWQSYVPYCHGTDVSLGLQAQTYDSFENLYAHTPLSGWDPAKLAFLPIVVEAPSGYKVAITEADLLDYPCMEVTNVNGDTAVEGFFSKVPDKVFQGGHNNLEGLAQTWKDVIAEDCAPGTAFPWRIVQVSREDGELAASDMVWKLATPSEDRDWSWVKPGKVAWEWWNAWNIWGVDFEAGINNDTYKYYIDFASRHGIEYVILDEGWAVNKQADLMQVVPEIDIPELVAYGKERGVGIILWAGYWAVNRDMENVFLHYSMMGVKGFKIDFMNRCDQPMVDFFTRCAQMGAKYKMLIDFHGAFKPTGLGRTYPNVLNYEGVYGLEQMKWRKTADTQVEYEVTIPFIRQLAGPMDYTPGAMRNATKDNYRAVYTEPMSLGTRCRQLAMYVVYEAPLMMMCDSPSAYMKEAECTEFLSAVPTVWDETRVLNGKIGDYVTIARRSGNDWYVGGMTDWDERDMSVSLSFLGAGEYELTIFRDGVNAGRAACDYVRETRRVTADDTLKLHLAPGGGWAAKIVKR